jgi:hypothetical protein
MRYRCSGCFPYCATVTNATVTVGVPLVTDLTAMTVAVIVATEVTVSATGALVVMLAVLQ